MTTMCLEVPRESGCASGLHSASSSIFDLPVNSHDSAKLLPGELIAQTSILSRPLDGPLTGASRRANPSFVVVSGGSGCNEICGAFNQNTSYVLPVSDDGGSSSEIIRVLGGPSIGDIRSRLIRLIPDSLSATPQASIKRLLSYRFPIHISEKDARDQWRDVVEGRGSHWDGIPSDRKEMIRGFLVFFESEVLRRSHKNFSFRNGSIGNFFLAGAQQFFRSLPSAIFLFSSITGSQANILPVIVTNHTCTLAARLENGESVVGQCQISHPPDSSSVVLPIESDLEEENAAVKSHNIIYSKDEETTDMTALQAPISEIFYINAYGQEIHPRPNPSYIEKLIGSDVLVYSCGSLWTSIIPCLILRGVSDAIVSSKSLKFKILLLNSCNDRETTGYNAEDYARAITAMLNKSRGMDIASRGAVLDDEKQDLPVSAFITHIVYLADGAVAVDKGGLQKMGVECLEMRSGRPNFDAYTVRMALSHLMAELHT